MQFKVLYKLMGYDMETTRGFPILLMYCITLMIYKTMILKKYLTLFFEKKKKKKKKEREYIYRGPIPLFNFLFFKYSFDL